MSLKCSRIRMSLEEFGERSGNPNAPETGPRAGSGNPCSGSGPEPWIGNIAVEPIRPGVDLLVVNLRAALDMELSTEFSGNTVGFALALEGDSQQTFVGTPDRVSALSIRAGRNYAAVCRPEKSCLHLRGGRWHRLVKLQIHSEAFPALLDGQTGSIPEVLRPVLQPSKPWRAAIHVPLSPALEYLGRQVVHCPFIGVARRLFMEAKALEILAEELGAVPRTGSGTREPYSSTEVDCLEKAREIIEREYRDPPTILALARRVGLNDFKLKRGFKDLWGTTIFGYVRRLRMEKARALLESGTYTVTEVAMATGHGCLGHFSAAFKKTFGVVPSRYLSGWRESCKPLHRSSTLARSLEVEGE